MTNQIFALSDAGTIGLLIILEALLSADNALVLAMIVRRLPKEQQKRALFYGLAGAFVFRLIVIVIASQLLNFWWLQAIGGLYLVFLLAKHFLQHSSGDSHKEIKASPNFWLTVLQAELTDIAFAIDSVLVAVAVENRPSKLWVVYIGAMLGVVFLRWAAGHVLRLLEKFPKLDHVAYLLVGWAGVKLLFIAGHTFEKWTVKEGRPPLPFHIPEMPPLVFWTGLILIAGVGGWFAFRSPADEALEESEVPAEIDEAVEEVFDENVKNDSNSVSSEP